MFVVILFFVLAACTAYAQESGSYTISGAEVTGNHRIDRAAIFAQLSHQKGTVTEALISDEVKSLYKTGFFSQVTATVVADPKNPNAKLLRYDVTEKPVIRKVFIKGNKKVSEDDLKDIFKFGANRFLDRTRIFALIKNALSYYQQHGYYDATIDYNVTPIGDDQVDLVLTVTEGRRYKIESISFRGLKTLDAADIRSTIQTKRYKWWNSWLYGTGRLNTEMLDNDKVIIRQYFLDHGLIDATLSDPVIDIKNGKIKIAFNVDEGRQYKVGTVTTSGDTLENATEPLLTGTKSTPGSVFSAAGIRADAFTISDKFTNIGYAFANVVPDTKINHDEATVDINFVVNKGKVVTVNRITIHGNDKTYDHVIRRELVIDEQDQYSSSLVKRSQQLLERLGYFQEVNITNEPADTPDKVNLNVNVHEAATGTFSAGAGYSSSDGPLVTGRIAENNFLGTGRSASIDADIAAQHNDLNNNLNLNLTDRRLFDSYWYGSINLLRSYRDFYDFDRLLTGGSAEVGYPLDRVLGDDFQDIMYSLGYQYLDVNIKNVDPNNAAQLVIDSEGKSHDSAAITKLTRNTINNPLDPKSGSRQIVSFETSGLGGDSKYWVTEAHQQWYYPLIESEDHGDLVFSWRFHFGYGESYNNEPFPLFKRYFPGGINSVRGFRERTLGPEDAFGHEYGGSKEVVNNLELIAPIAKSIGLKGVVFYDAGQAFDDHESIDIAKLRQAYGIGLRWSSPIGPIRVEFGIPIDRRAGEQRIVTLFAFGAPF